MKPRFLKSSAFFAVVSVLAAAMALSTATYAWFTANRLVSTSRVETDTDTMELRLYVKEPSDAAFTGSECALRFTGGKALSLIPVSTADLRHFVYAPTTAEGNAARFVSVPDAADQELFCYAGIDMRAELTGSLPSAKVAVYLDDDAALGALAQKAEEHSLLLNAARLGIRLSGADSGRIFFLSQQSNPENRQIRNTMVAGQLLEDGMVLKSDGAGNVTAVPDPAVPLSACMPSDDDEPGEPLFYLDPGVDYRIEVFFYLEGCDPDCSDAVSFHAADLTLAFYATLVTQG